LSSPGGGGDGDTEQLLLLEIDAGPYGILYHTGTASAGGSGWSKIGGTAGLGLAKSFSESAEWRLRHDGATTKKFRVDMFMDLTGDTASTTGSHGIYKNGTLVTESELQRVIYMNPYDVPTHNHCFVELAQNDYVEPWVYNVSSAVGTAAGQLIVTPLPDDYGLLYLTAGASNTTAGWQKAPGTTSIGATVNNFSQEANNRLRYDGTTAQQFLITADVSYAAANNEEIAWAIYKNGSIVTNSTTAYSLNRPFDNQESPVSIQCLVSLEQNDYVEVWFNRSSTESIDVEGLILSAQALTSSETTTPVTGDRDYAWLRLADAEVDSAELPLEAAWNTIPRWYDVITTVELSSNFTTPRYGRLVYGGTDERIFLVSAMATMEPQSNAGNAKLSITRNGLTPKEWLGIEDNENQYGGSIIRPKPPDRAE